MKEQNGICFYLILSLEHFYYSYFAPYFSFLKTLSKPIYLELNTNDLYVQSKKKRKKRSFSIIIRIGPISIVLISIFIIIIMICFLRNENRNNKKNERDLYSFHLLLLRFRNEEIIGLQNSSFY